MANFYITLSAVEVGLGPLAPTLCSDVKQALSLLVPCILNWLNDWAHSWRPESAHVSTLIGMHQHGVDYWEYIRLQSYLLVSAT